MNEPLILAFNLPEPSQLGVRAICRGLGLRLRVVSREEFGLPIGALCGMPAPVSAARVTPFDDEMLVMCGLDEPVFNAFLQSLRFSGIPRIDLKAVLTPSNAAWNARQLRDELAREHEAMRRNRPQG